jgi:2-oxoglutarate ferredoxin oxidoreductase subunit beta
VARGFSGDREQLVPLIKAGVRHRGCAVLDVVSPCVTFNDHPGSTKSYAYTRENYHQAVRTDFVPPATEITTRYAVGEAMPVTLHDGSTLLLRKTSNAYDPTDRSGSMQYLEAHRSLGEVVTGLLYINEELPEMHDILETGKQPLVDLPMSDLCPGAGALKELQKGLK